MPRTPRLTTRIALGWSRRHARRFPPAELEPLAPDTQARILVINTTGIGDTIFCTAPVADLRESFPNAKIEILVDRRRVELVESNPRLDDVVVYPGKFKRVRSVIRNLRGREYDIAMVQHANDPDVVPMVAASRPRYMVGYENHTFSELYSVKLPPPDREGGAHTIDARLALCKAIGAKGEHWHTELYPDDGDEAQAAELLASLELETGEAIALNIGGSLPSKRWPITHWTALARVLGEKGRKCLFVGGPDDALLAEMIREHTPDNEHVQFAVGKLPFMGSVAMLKMCAGLVSGDTGLMQAALAMDVPTVGLFGPDDPKWTGPYPQQENVTVISVPEEKRPDGYNRRDDKEGVLMKMITVDEVVSAIESVGI